ncbi:hypothetical protein F8M41_019623 [Gigaspora margarita]|uniref:Uncharacterized protein n=1 Tax=Gigaspora margarita TaxID=4874 RepID=A0A8H4AJN2_GIGMA|nr:hypothetical protein F8M41_019623 [Gigaspora margarita]
MNLAIVLTKMEEKTLFKFLPHLIIVWKRSDAKINEYKRKHEELDEEKLTIVKKLRSEEAKYLQLHDSIIYELDKIEIAQMEANQAFEKKFLSFIEGNANLLFVHF